MNRSVVWRGVMALASATVFMLGCSEGGSAGNLPPEKPFDPAAEKEAVAKINAGATGGYKGAPGAPYKAK